MTPRSNKREVNATIVNKEENETTVIKLARTLNMLLQGCNKTAHFTSRICAPSETKCQDVNVHPS